jgi:hypothetical protein
VTNTLHIERLSSTYLVSRDHPSPLRLCSELDDLARAHIADGCAAAMEPLLDPADPSVWVIRSLQIDLLLDVHAAAPEGIARFWARHIASSVAQVLAAGEDGDSVLRFADRAAFLAHFLHSLAQDHAWPWYFREFDSLRSLPRGSALREALLREPSQIDAVLLELDRTHRLPLIAVVLTDNDHARIVACCAGTAVCAPATLLALLRGLSAADLPPSLLPAYVRLRREHPELGPAETAKAAEHLDAIVRWVRSGTVYAIVDAAMRGSTPGLCSDPFDLSTFVLLRAVVEQKGVSALAPLLSIAQRAQSMPVADEQKTDLGAVFLLCAALAETPSLLAVFGGAEQQQHLVYLLLLTCFAPRIGDAWREPVLRLLAGLSDLPSLASLAAASVAVLPPGMAEAALPEDVAWFQPPMRELVPGLELTPEMQTELNICGALLLRAFARMLPALGGSSIEYLWHNVLAGDARIVTGSDGMKAYLQSRPLQIVLRMAALHDRVLHLPWLDPPYLTIHFEQT